MSKHYIIPELNIKNFNKENIATASSGETIADKLNAEEVKALYITDTKASDIEWSITSY